MRNALDNNPPALNSTGQSTDFEFKLGIFPHLNSSFSLIKSRLRLVPAALAILVQCAAFITVLLSVLVIGFFAPIHFPIFSLVLMQALIATGFCIFVGMASWWRWIHFFFPLALWGMSLWQVPNEVYLIGFLIEIGTTL